MKTLRKERFSVLMSIVAAAVTFPIVGLLAFVVVSIAFRIALEILDSSGSWVGGPYDKVITGIGIAIVFGVPVIVAYLVSRALYMRVRWEAVDNSLGRYCYNCSYDLTGNISGICPECGTAVSKNAGASLESHQNPSRK